MLKEGDFYDKKENDLNPEFAVELQKVVSEMVEKEIIGTKEEEFLVKKEWVSPILYGLPKKCLNFGPLSLGVVALWKVLLNLLIIFSNL